MEGRHPPAPSSTRSSKDSPPTAILACEACKQRKIKCDRAFPCAACRNSGRSCVAVVRPRLPRGRKGGRKETTGELKARINRLENLVQSLSDSIPGQHDDVDVKPDHSPSTRMDISTETQGFSPRRSISGDGRPNFQAQLGGSLWESLSNEVAGLRQILEQPDDEDEASSATSEQERQNKAMDDVTYTNILLNMTRPDNFQLPPVPQTTSQVFASIYAANVDPPTKFTYAPLVKSMIERGTPYLDYDPESAPLQALKASIFYACVCSMTDSQCRELLGNTQDFLRDLWKSATEAALAKAGWITSSDLASLQAFIMYLQAMRGHNTGRMAWTLTALAIRIAKAMNLHKEEALAHLGFFEAEMRRRVWYALVDLDLQGAMDRGTEPIVRPDDWTTALPLNINDSDLQPGRVDPCQPRQGYTDCTIICLAASLTRIERCINYVSLGDQQHKNCAAYHWDWNERIKYSSTWIAAVNGVLPPNSRPTTAFERRCHTLIGVISATLGIWVYRPMVRHTALGPPPCDSNTLLGLAVSCIEAYTKIRYQFGEHDPWQWCCMGFVLWHPFAVLLAELCVDHEGADELITKGWRLADQAYVELSLRIADGESGPLWGPIKRLMRNAMIKRPRDISPPEVAWARLELQRTSLTYPRPSPTAPSMGSPHSEAMQNIQFENIFGIPDPCNEPCWSAGWTPEPLQQTTWSNWGTFLDDMGQHPNGGWVNGLSPHGFSPSIGPGMSQNMPIPDQQGNEMIWPGV